MFPLLRSTVVFRGGARPRQTKEKGIKRIYIIKIQVFKIKLYSKPLLRAREMAQQLRALVSLAED